MYSARAILWVLGVLSVRDPEERTSSQTPARPERVVIAVSAALDGKGDVLRDTRILVEGGKIVAIDPTAGPVDHDLRGLTVAPGWIDAHVHITWSFDSSGKNAGFGEHKRLPPAHDKLYRPNQLRSAMHLP